MRDVCAGIYLTKSETARGFGVGGLHEDSRHFTPGPAVAPVLSGCRLNVQKAWYAFGSAEVRLGMVLGLVTTRESGFGTR